MISLNRGVGKLKVKPDAPREQKRKTTFNTKGKRQRNKTKYNIIPEVSGIACRSIDTG